MQGGLASFETRGRHPPAALLRMTYVFDGIKDNRHPEEARSAVSKDARRLSKFQTEILPESPCPCAQGLRMKRSGPGRRRSPEEGAGGAAEPRPDLDDACRQPAAPA